MATTSSANSSHDIWNAPSLQRHSSFGALPDLAACLTASNMMDADLIHAAHAVAGRFGLSEPRLTAGQVGAALRTRSGKIYTGICVDLACGIGTCAEHSAIVEMLKHRETEVESIVAISDSRILPPCGRCRELLVQIDAKNKSTVVIIADDKCLRLDELLPHYWLDVHRLRT
jgi:cytidine deaminase